MPDTSPRTILLGNVSPVDSERTVENLADVNLTELREEEGTSIVVDEENEVVGIHRRQVRDCITVTQVSLPEDMGLAEAVGTVIRVYDGDHSNDPPEWAWSETDPVIAEAIADHYNRQGGKCEVGIPDGWERKRNLDPAAKRWLQEAKGDSDDQVELPPMAGGSQILDRFLSENGLTPEEYFFGRHENLRTAAGRDFQSRVMGDTASTGTGIYAAANWIALTENSSAPLDADTTLTGELTTGGLGRAQAAYAHSAGGTTYTLIKTFTSSDGSTRTPAKIGVFNASTSGTMVFSTLIPSPPALVSGDSLTITETVTL
jgi:hypothetical protein